MSKACIPRPIRLEAFLEAWSFPVDGSLYYPEYTQCLLKESVFGKPGFTKHEASENSENISAMGWKKKQCFLFASWLVEMWNAFISSLKTFGSFWTLITKICYLNLILTQLDALKPQSHILLCNDSYVNWSSYTQQWQQFKASNCTGRHPGGLLFPPLDPDGKPVRVERQVGVVWRWRTVWPLHPRLHVSPIFLLHGLAQGNLNSSGILWLVNTFANHFAFLHQRLFNLICA